MQAHDGFVAGRQRLPINKPDLRVVIRNLADRSPIAEIPLRPVSTAARRLSSSDLSCEKGQPRPYVAVFTLNLVETVVCAIHAGIVTADAWSAFNPRSASERSAPSPLRRRTESATSSRTP